MKSKWNSALDSCRYVTGVHGNIACPWCYSCGYCNGYSHVFTCHKVWNASLHTVFTEYAGLEVLHLCAWESCIYYRPVHLPCVMWTCVCGCSRFSNVHNHFLKPGHTSQPVTLQDCSSFSSMSYTHLIILIALELWLQNSCHIEAEW